MRTMLDYHAESAARTPAWLGYVVAMLSVLLLTLILDTLGVVFPLNLFPTSYVLLTMIVAYYFGEGPAVLATIFGWLVFTYRFVRPEGLWPLASTPEDWARHAAYLMGTTVVAIAAARVRKANRRTQRLADDAVALNQRLREQMDERERAEEVQSRLAAIVESSDDAIISKNLDNIITTWNTGAERMLGYTADEIVGKHVSTIIPEEYREEIDLLLDAVARGETVRHYDTARLTKDGQIKYVWVSASPVLDRTGTLVGTSIIARDVTERKRAEEEIRKLNTELERRVEARTAQLQETLARLNEALEKEQAARQEANESRLKAQQVLETAPDGIIIADEDGAITFANNQASEIFMYGRDEIITKTVEDLIPEIYRKTHVGHRADYAARPRVRQMGVGLELYGLRKDGMEFPVEIALSPTWEKGNLRVTAVIRDITERKRVENQVRELNADLKRRTVELEAANKELEAFSYSVSHDLRAPLRAIDGFSNTLLKYYLDVLDERGQDYLKRVRAASQRMAQLIDDILGLSRATRAEMHRQRLDLSAMAGEILEGLQNSEPDRKAEITVEPGMVLEADNHLMRIAMDNLLRNAWKFTSKREMTRIEVGSLDQNGKRVYFIRDNGAGFDREYADKLFSPFQRLHSESEFPGTGIGLALVQRILRRHGGRIWAEAAVDQGATFYFTIGEVQK
jgi:PAS domain S-box-containing protein